MTTNIVQAMSAVYWLQKYPSESHQLTLSVGLGVTAGGSTTGASVEGTVQGGASYTWTVKSEEGILRALGEANDKIQSQLQNRLESIESPVAGKNGSVLLGQSGEMMGHSSAATFFGTLARKSANVEARNIYTRNYPNRGDILGRYKYPATFHFREF